MNPSWSWHSGIRSRYRSKENHLSSSPIPQHYTKVIKKGGWLLRLAFLEYAASPLPPVVGQYGEIFLLMARDLAARYRVL